MSGWIFGLFLAATVVAVWWWRVRSNQPHWDRLERILEDLGQGKEPESFVFRDGGNFARLSSALERIAEQQGALRLQLKREASDFETILGGMEEGVMLVDGQHTLRHVNQSFVRLFDLKGDPRGQTVLRTLREPQIEEMVTAALTTNEAQTRDVSVNARNPRHFAVHAVPVRGDAGRQGVVTIFRDVTRLKQLEDVRREFVANVSHELRTPLSIFHGYVENLLDDPTMPRKEQAEVFEILHKHSMRLNALLEDLLILARLESRHDDLEVEPLNLSAKLKEIAGDLTGRAEKKNISIELDLAEELPSISADPLRLEQVFNNLLENAIKYTENGGRIALRAKLAGDFMDIRVEDSGVGIPPIDLPHIFERFYRADKARSREQGGTGLGLSIVKHIVQAHGGTVRAESTYGKGTTIILAWPLSAASVGAVHA